MIFYGFGVKQELAGYAFEVLLRQLKHSRRQYMATTLKRVRILKNKQFRADEYCRGWVRGVRRMVDQFANSEEEQNALASYRKQLNCIEDKVRSVSVAKSVAERSNDDWNSGIDSGLLVRLNRAMSQSRMEALEGE